MTVAKRYSSRVAHIESIGTLYSGKQDVGGGSGLLIGDRYVLTNEHVIPEARDYEKLQINVRLKSRLLPPLAVKSVRKDKEKDLALLELADRVEGAGGDRCPMPAISEASLFPMGSTIFFLGYPVDQDLSITSGLLSNQSGDRGRWQTDALINYGNSGGPAFDKSGDLIGIAVGGIVSIDTGDGKKGQVTGVNFLIPVALVKQSSIYPAIESMSAAERCWRDVNPHIAASEATNTVPFPSAAAGSNIPLPSHLSRDYSVSVTKDNHPKLHEDSRLYEFEYKAEPGYKIVGCDWRGVSENHWSDLICNVGAGGASAELSFRLTSGPLFDRWRGWLHGTITLTQNKV